MVCSASCSLYASAAAPRSYHCATAGLAPGAVDQHTPREEQMKRFALGMAAALALAACGGGGSQASPAPVLGLYRTIFPFQFIKIYPRR